MPQKFEFISYMLDNGNHIISLVKGDRFLTCVLLLSNEKGFGLLGSKIDDSLIGLQ